MSYTDLTSTFINKLLNSFQRGQKLVANDNYLLDQYGSYRRPNLVWINGVYVDVENNVASDANATKIIFPDGNVRTVSEDTSVSAKYRRVNRTGTISLVTPHSGGIVFVAINMAYAIYAVKTTDDATKFVLVATVILPLAANLATLNAAYGTNGWVYLGMVWRGDNALDVNSWVSFVQEGNVVKFTNLVFNYSGNPMTGLLLAATSSATSLTYTYVAGCGYQQIPDIIKIAMYGVAIGSSSNIRIKEQTGTTDYAVCDYGGVIGFCDEFMVDAAQGLKVSTFANAAIDFYLTGYIDHVLGVGSNPKI